MCPSVQVAGLCGPSTGEKGATQRVSELGVVSARVGCRVLSCVRGEPLETDKERLGTEVEQCPGE